MKKAQSQIITTVLIILLVPVAIVIVYQVIDNTLNPKESFEIYECHNETITDYICIKPKDLCTIKNREFNDDCYYQKKQTTSELCKKVNEMNFCKEGKQYDNKRCLVGFEKSEEDCKIGCIGAGKYINLIKIYAGDLDGEWLDENCNKINEDYRCGSDPNYLVKRGSN